MENKHLLPYCILSIIVIFAAVRVGMYEEAEDNDPGTFAESELVFAIDLNSKRNGDKLVAGYNYALLHQFAEEMGSTAVIKNAFNQENFIDSLKRGVIALLVLPFNDTLQIDSISFTIPVDSLTMWAVRKNEPGALAEADKWIREYEEAEEKVINRNVYLRRFNPHKRANRGDRVSAISPYDESIKYYAKKLGWDWRLLAAVVFQESRFHIEARSPRGATGLMQMLPSTARRFGVDDLFDPEESLKAGVEFLLRLQRMFTDEAADAEELCKFTLAAYNAGEGRMRDCINYAKHRGADASTWEGLSSIIPEMREEENVQLDTIKLGVFKGYETLAYIDSVLAIYNSFCTICPK